MRLPTWLGGKAEPVAPAPAPAPVVEENIPPLAIVGLPVTINPSVETAAERNAGRINTLLRAIASGDERPGLRVELKRRTTLDIETAEQAQALLNARKE